MGGGLRSRIETLALWERRRRAVLRPRPEEPPEMRKLRFEICMVRQLWRIVTRRGTRKGGGD